MQRTALVPENTSLRTQAEYDETMKSLTQLRQSAASMRLSVATNSMDSVIRKFDSNVPTVGELRKRLSEWHSCFKTELESVMLLLVLPHRLPYYSGSGYTTAAGFEINQAIARLTRFPEAHYDLREAGNCLAFERFTACVFHLMRVAEYGLVSVARAANTPEEKIGRGWDGCIQGIESYINTVRSTKPITDWQDQVKRYGDLCSWFKAISSGWRNPVSHVPRVYSESTAVAMFSATSTLFKHLQRAGFGQAQIPSTPILPPEY